MLGANGITGHLNYRRCSEMVLFSVWHDLRLDPQAGETFQEEVGLDLDRNARNGLIGNATQACERGFSRMDWLVIALGEAVGIFNGDPFIPVATLGGACRVGWLGIETWLSVVREIDKMKIVLRHMSFV